MKLISRLGYVIRLAVFYGFVRHLPDSTVPGGRLWRRLRYVVCRPLFHHCGDNVNIERGAYIGAGRTISIGPNSGIGINASLGISCTVGIGIKIH